MRDIVTCFYRNSQRFCRFVAGGYARLALERKKDFRPRVVVPISGGLGNQIWQYCIGMGAQFFSGLPVEYDLSWYARFGFDIRGRERRDFELTQTFPALELTVVKPDEAVFFKRYFSYEPPLPSCFDARVYQSLRSRYIRGFCAHADYVTLLPEDLWKRFRFSQELISRNAMIVQELGNSCTSVAVHVRCGDYLGSMHEVATVSYYRRAMHLLKRLLAPKRPCFYIFSNDMSWAREKLIDMQEKMVFMDKKGTQSVLDDFYLMTQCHHHIIANSTLSWMGAWLCGNLNKRVVMPEIWFNEKAPNYIRQGSETAFCVDGWIRLAVN